MKRIKDIFKAIVMMITLIAFLSVIILCCTFPIVISVFTGNWWFMLLYIIMPLLVPATIFLLQVIIAVVELIVTKN